MNIQTLLAILWARRLTIAVIAGIAVIASILLCLMTPRIYTATADLIVDSKGQDPVSGQASITRTMAGYLGTQAEVIRSRPVATKVADQLKLASLPEIASYLHLKGEEPGDHSKLVNFVTNNLEVTTRRDSNVISIAFKWRDPVLATQVADAVAQAYIDTNLDLRIEPARQITRWYDQQLASLRASLVEKQNALSSYQEKHGILVSSDRLDLESAKLNELSSMVVAAQGERLNSTTRNEISRGSLPAQALDSPQVQKLSNDLTQAQARLADLATKVGENHPQYRQAESDVEVLKQQLAQAVRLVTGSLKSSVALSLTREAQLEAELEAQKERVLQLSRNRNELALLKQEADNAQAAYDAALARATQTRLESQVALTDISILNTATAAKTAPKPAMTLLLGTLTGLLLGLAAAICLEWFDRRVRTPLDLEVGLGLPVLARIPANRA